MDSLLRWYVVEVRKTGKKHIIAAFQFKREATVWMKEQHAIYNSHMILVKIG